MYYYVSGVVAHVEPYLAVIDCGGVGYACRTTSYTLSQMKKGDKAKLFTYLSVREDAMDLYGFFSQEELKLFQQLISVSGVGPKAALAILSSMTPEQFTLAVVTGDEKALTAAPGVGKKLAQRILLELKDKLAGEQIEAAGSGPAVPWNGAGGKAAEASAALAALGYSQSEIGASLRGVDTGSLTVEEIVRQCLRAMVKN